MLWLECLNAAANVQGTLNIFLLALLFLQVSFSYAWNFCYIYYSFLELQVLEAVTTKECQEEFSQESLETLGDSFLKYVVTQHLYCKYTLHHEGTLTKMKKNLISNAALCQLACNNNLVVSKFLLIICLSYSLLFWSVFELDIVMLHCEPPN
jgi:hypothetical protein